MKKGYKKLIAFEAVLMCLLLLNTFVFKLFNIYSTIIFLAVTLIIFKPLFGFEKDRQRHTKDIILEEIIALIVFFLLYYLLGIVTGFAKTGNYYTFEGLKNFIIPLIATVLLREILRYMILKKAEGSLLLNILTCLFFIIIEISEAIFYSPFATKYEIFLFLATRLIPSISLNIVFTIMSPRTGYKPLILYGLIVGLYVYLLPIIPNPGPYITAIINFLLPIIVGYRVYLFFQKYKDAEVQRVQKKNSLIGLIIPTCLIIFLVYITSGYFHYYALAIASGSMSPIIKKGDVVIVEKIDEQYDKLQEGEVIAFKYNNVVIVHRLNKIIKIGDTYYFYTKGDANEDVDNWVVEENMIIGVVNLKVSYIGYPTVWLNEL